ncbi:MAG: TlpA family protein disulfide reductase [bacterium]
MKWIVRFFVSLIILLSVFGFYQIKRTQSQNTPRSKFKASIVDQGSKSVPNGPKPTDTLHPELRRQASKLGFEFDSIDTEAPEIRLTTLDNSSIHLSKYRGKWLILNFWASWCPPCREEMSSFETLRNQLNPAHFVVRPINVMESRTTVKSFLSQHDLSLPILLDQKGKTSDKFRVEGLPVTWVITPKGQPIMKLQGKRDWHRGKLYEFLKRLPKL